MDKPVCLVPSKEGQCVLLQGHTGYPHTSPNGFQWYEAIEVKRKPGRPRKIA